MRTLIRSIALGALLLPMLLIPGCKECPECPPEQVQKIAPPPFLIERSNVCQTEFNCMRPEFDRHFTAGGTMLQRTDNLLQWAALTSLFNATPPQDQEHGLRIHYGLSGSGPYTLELGLEPVHLQRRVNMFYDVRPSGNVYPLNPDGSLASAITEAAWRSGFGDPYFSMVEVLRSHDDAAPDRLARDFDHGSYTFRMVDLVAQHVQNSEPSHLRIYSIGDPIIRQSDTDEDDWRHVLAIVCATDNDPTHILLDDNVDPGAPFRNKALDLGSPCPPSCVLARFYRYGMAPRSNCRCQ